MGTSVHLRTLCKTVFLRHFEANFDARRGGMRQRQFPKLRVGSSTLPSPTMYLVIVSGNRLP
jgi:hypothetical protein